MPAHLFQVRFLSTAAFTRPYGDDIHVRIHNLIQIIFIAVLHLSSVSRKRCRHRRPPSRSQRNVPRGLKKREKDTYSIRKDEEHIPP